MDLLYKCPLFKGVNPDDLDKYLESIHYQIKKYNKDQIIAQAGEECNALLIMLKGSVKGEMIDPSGKAIKIEDIEPPKPLAIAFIFGQNNYFPVNIVATTDVEIFKLPKESIIRLMQVSAPFLQNFMNNISNRAQFLSNKIRFLTFQTIRGKLAHYLLQLAGSINGEIILPKSQEELASLFGVTRPSLGRAIRELHNEGIIFAQGKSIKILDRKLLLQQLKKG
ncbi:Crp/Fnr family transcriptional regulator [Carboxylicivirga caseinilyticus]|uniref:Crp/Fnr family transcriptional regulator n=1 Tax=Carboxylicivirga caseinilyticus TaxID=3417572 RepID=UPI003D33CE2F|nr:Crp/Fnr family transcriptional regulator [Marinilabiliaceae bacterium A049]